MVSNYIFTSDNRYDNNLILGRLLGILSILLLKCAQLELSMLVRSTRQKHMFSDPSLILTAALVMKKEIPMYLCYDV